MADCFIDSSSVVKYHVEEAGSAAIRDIFDPRAGHNLYIAEVTLVEVAAALHRRSGEELARSFLADAPGGLNTVAPSSALLRAAAELACQHVLRGDAAVQLAAALALRAAQAADGRALVALVSSDVELNAAAAVEGVRVIDPTQ